MHTTTGQQRFSGHFGGTRLRGFGQTSRRETGANYRVIALLSGRKCRYADMIAWFVFAAGFDYRSKLANPRRRSAWDWALFAGGRAPKAQLGTLSSMASPPINPSLIPVMFFPLVTGSRS